MRGRFQRWGAVVAVVVTALGVSPACAQEKPRQGPDAPPPPLLIPPSPRPGPPPAPARPSFITNPAWATRPSPRYPTLATTNGVMEGRVTLVCTLGSNGRLSRCEIVDETPEGNGFGQSALAATAQARVSPRTLDLAAPGARVRFTVRLVSPTAPPDAPTKLPNVPVPPATRTDHLESLPSIVPVPPAPPLVPEWATPPVVEFPERALSRGIEAGRATIQCRVGGEGLPLDCETIHEDPAGAGFGPAALRALPDARVAPTIPAGTYIRFVINFSTPPKPSPAPTSLSDASAR